ncbi:MAG: hypothetical protein AB1726_09195 [Planctomycetota bacterium]
MKGFFADMNFPRAVILVSLASAVVLGALVWRSTGRLAEVERQRATIKQEIRAIQELALELDGLDRLAGEGRQVQESDSFALYVREVAQAEHVDIGTLNVTPSETDPMPGIKDRHLAIQPANRNVHFRRANIGNYLYRLEADSNRVKVTRIELNPAQKLRPGEIGSDEWDWEAQITARVSVSQ